MNTSLSQIKRKLSNAFNIAEAHYLKRFPITKRNGLLLDGTTMGLGALFLVSAANPVAAGIFGAIVFVSALNTAVDLKSPQSRWDEAKEYTNKKVALLNK